MKKKAKRGRAELEEFFQSHTLTSIYRYSSIELIKNKFHESERKRNKKEKERGENTTRMIIKKELIWREHEQKSSQNCINEDKHEFRRVELLLLPLPLLLLLQYQGIAAMSSAYATASNQ